jgi:hypothetical protein
MTVFNKNGLTIEFAFSKVPNNPNNIVTISMTAQNSQPMPMTDFLFQVAVPKVRAYALSRNFIPLQASLDARSLHCLLIVL